MSKFHINKHGVPAPCRAKEGNCPLGGDSGNENHFNTQEEAQAHIDMVHEGKHGVLPGMNEVKKEQKFETEDGHEIKVGDTVFMRKYDDKNDPELVFGDDGEAYNYIDSYVYAGEMHPEDIHDEVVEVEVTQEMMNSYLGIKEDSFNYKPTELKEMHGKQAEVEYDGKKFSGEVVGTHYDAVGSDKNGVIVKNADGVVKHIKTGRMTSLNLTGEGTAKAEKQDLSTEQLKDVGNQASERVKVKEPNLPDGKDSIRSIDDLETLVVTREGFVTSQEHNPVNNAQSMFEHVADKSGKLYRYNDTDSPYLETHNYNFDRTMSEHQSFLENKGYFSENYFDDDENPREMFREDVSKHRELHEYSSKLAVEYGKDYEKNVVMSGKYTFDDQEKIKGEYKQAIADKVGAFVQNYGEDE